MHVQATPVPARVEDLSVHSGAPRHAAAPGDHGGNDRRPLWRLCLEVTAASLSALGFALVTGRSLLVVAGTLAVWAVVVYQRGRTNPELTSGRLNSIRSGSLVVLASVAVGIASGILPARETATVVLTVAIAATASLMVRRITATRGPVRTLIVGGRHEVAKLASNWLDADDVKVVGVALADAPSEGEAPKDVFGAPNFGGLDEVADAVKRTAADHVVVAATPEITDACLRRLSWSLEDTPAILGVAGVLHPVADHRVLPSRVGDAMVLNVTPPRPSALVRIVKSIFDRVVGAVLLVLVAPLLALLTLAVRFDSKGPGFFRQRRAGRNGKQFTMYKLRTMKVNAEEIRKQLIESNEADGVLFKIKRDPRMTRMGRLLRRTSLDELPQLINVVKGDMSLIGPRPALPEEVSQYDDDARRRLAVKPGLTGLWQVSGRSDLSWNKSVQLDLSYVDNISLSEDLRIAVRTVDAVVSSRGAY